MPVDPCFARLLADPRNELRPPPPHVSLAAMRQGNKAFLIAEPKAPLHAIENLVAPGPAGQLALLYPTVDPACDSVSMNEFGRGHMLTRRDVQWFWSSYLRSSADAADPEVCLLRADLRNLPRTTIVTAECDPLRDEGEALAARRSPCFAQGCRGSRRCPRVGTK